mgnify:CR=1 FL=1
MLMMPMLLSVPLLMHTEEANWDDDVVVSRVYIYIIWNLSSSLSSSLINISPTCILSIGFILNTIRSISMLSKVVSVSMLSDFIA